MTTFTMTLAQNIYNSNDEFPINFEDAWQWLGYATKASAKRNLKQFSEGVDFSTSVLKSILATRPAEQILLTIDCFKMLAMMAKTDVGNVARKYFLECEKIAKESMDGRLAPQEVTQGLVTELHDAAKIVCFNDTLADMAINDSLDYQKKLNPMYEATVRVSLIRSTLRLGMSPARSMEARKCTGTVNKQLRQTQDAMEGYDTIAPELRPKSELADITRARELNPSSMEQGLFALTPLSQSELQAAKRVDLSKIKNPTRYASIEQSKLAPKLPDGFVIDIPLDNIH
jgi:phage anti-repressor protein